MKKFILDITEVDEQKNTHNSNKDDDYARTSLILNQQKVAKIKEIGYREAITMKDIFDVAMDLVIERYESVHGEVNPRPEKTKGDIKNVFC